MRLSNRDALVTGSSQGIDRGIDLRLAEGGADVVLNGREYDQGPRDSGRGGWIINNSSVHEELPFPNFTGYCASKGGLKMLTRNLAIKLASLGITVNSVAPGAIETPINSALMNLPEKIAALFGNIPAQHLGQSRDVSGAVAFLASDDTSYMTGTTFFSMEVCYGITASSE
ncbi:SDR family NAD(P)-dependent oxidoreductase [Nitrosomonas sp. ANs5]|uniref:SDR family NAD(P)-dependent oxidoreductase n=1 Tax=Nitrosomonas sp. ANs5 TaxID=3423941 RepID=UPI003D357A3D